MLLPVDRTDNMIPLPVSLLLTPEGAAVFSQGKMNLKRLTSISGNPAEGLVSENFNAQTVQKLVMNAYLGEIYVQMPEMLRSRMAIIDTTKLVTFGMLYKKMNPSLARMLFESEVMQEYNRKNRNSQIKDLQHIDRGKLEMLMKARSHDFEVMELEIRNEVIQKILSNEELEEEDRLLRMRSLDKFIAFIDKRIWYLYYVIYQTPLRTSVHEVFADMVDSYLDRTKIATHLSTMLMELIQNAEKAHFERLIMSKRMVHHRSEVDKFLKDINNRKRVVDAALSTDQLLDIAWHFDSGSSVGSRQHRIEITLSNYGLISRTVEEDLNQKMKTDTTGMNLSDFYDGGGGDKLGAGLGLLYLSYLEDECRKARINFTCNIFPEPRKEKTTVKINVIF